MNQVITPSPLTTTVIPGGAIAFDTNYSTIPDNQLTTGLALRVYWDSSQITFNNLTNLLNTDLQPQGNPRTDSNNGDADSSTNTFLSVTWINSSGTWPPTGSNRLFTANFNATPQFAGTRVNFTGVAAQNFTFSPTSFSGGSIAAVLADEILRSNFLQLINNADLGGRNGRFFDLTNNSDVLNNIAGEVSQNFPGGIRALSGDDSLSGGFDPPGIDVINGNFGNDTILGESRNDLPGAADYLRGGQGNDLVSGSGGNDVLNGNDFVRGGQGDDLIQGGSGNDILIGDFGRDTLFGDGLSTNEFGADTFVFRTETETGDNFDVVADFRAIEADRIVIVATDFGLSGIILELVPNFIQLTIPSLVESVNDVVIRRASTGLILGVLDGISDIDSVRASIQVVSPSDSALSIG